jgi:cobaltochelatase CobT
MAYKIYTTEYDEIVRPTDLVDLNQLTNLAEGFHKLCPVEDLEPLKERLDKLKAPVVPTAITILIDNSGSMRGRPILAAVGVAAIIGSYLDRLGVPNEILGFTTARWKGGSSREQWILDGKAERSPGRLNDLRHIIYKSFDEKISDVRHNLALMLMPGMLKENIDGEAVQWACTRLRGHPTERRKLLVLSDGAPVDDSTLSFLDSNREDVIVHGEVEKQSILTEHLTEVLTAIRKKGDIEIDAIGINHDVSRFYGVGDLIREPEELGPVAIEKLEKLLAP